MRRQSDGEWRDELSRDIQIVPDEGAVLLYFDPCWSRFTAVDSAFFVASVEPESAATSVSAAPVVVPDVRVAGPEHRGLVTRGAPLRIDVTSLVQRIAVNAATGDDRPRLAPAIALVVPNDAKGPVSIWAGVTDDPPIETSSPPLLEVYGR